MAGGRDSLIAAACLAALAGSACNRQLEESPRRALTDAVGARRLVEPRLTGGFAYAPCMPSSTSSTSSAPPGAAPDAGPSIAAATCSGLPRAGSADFTRLTRAIAAVQRRRSRAPRGPALAAAGVASLLTATREGAERAVRSLEAAVEEQPVDAGALNDLAAAYLVRAGARQEPADLVRALDAVERAHAVSPEQPEARFNRALVFERLCLRGAATAAWQEIQRSDRGTGWATEAASHIARLARLPAVELTGAERTALRDAARGTPQHGAPEVRRLVALSPQSAREYAMNDLLAQWGTAFLAGDTVRAAEPLAAARAIGAALRSLPGDETVAGAVAAIDATARSADPSGAQVALARAHSIFPAGLRLAHALDVEKARPPLLAADRAFAAAGSPMAAWTATELGGVELNSGRNDRAALLFAGVAQRPDAAVLPSVQGRARWGLAMVRGRQGRLSDSLADFDAAGAFYRRAGEVPNQASIEGQIGELRSLLGEVDAAWSHSYRALTIQSASKASRQLDNLLFVGAADLLREGKPHAALAFADEDVAVAGSAGQASMLAEDLLQRSKVYSTLADYDAALADIARAQAAASAEPSRNTRDRVLPNIDLMKGEMTLARSPQAALPLLEQADAAFKLQHRPVEAGRSMLDRARALIAMNDPAAAEAQLRDAIDLFVGERAALSDAAQRLSFSETSQALFDEMILLQVHRQGRPRVAFAYSEMARSVPTGRSSPPAAPRASVSLVGTDTSSPELVVARDLAAIPSDVALLEYSVAGDHLFTWVLRQGIITLIDRPVVARDLDRMVSSFAIELRGGDRRRIDSIAAALFSILIPATVARLPPEVRLVVVPDKSLNAVPFAALRSAATGRYLIEDHGLTLAPSVELYLSRRQRSSTADGRRGWTALLVGNPAFDRHLFPQLAALPGAAAETEALRQLYARPVVLAGADAERPRLLSELDRHEVFSFAGHAVDNPRSPADSYLVLAPSDGRPKNDGILFAHEVSGLHFQRLRLVVLSACHTVAANNSRTAGITGLARPFLDAGVQAVIGTLWEIDDESASFILPAFHRGFLSGLDTGAALRAAQLAMLHGDSRDLRSPFHWAAFQVMGEIH